MTTHRTWLWNGPNSWDEIIMLLVFNGETWIGITFGGYIANSRHTLEQAVFAKDSPHWPGNWTEVL